MSWLCSRLLFPSFFLSFHTGFSPPTFLQGAYVSGLIMEGARWDEKAQVKASGWREVTSLVGNVLPVSSKSFSLQWSHPFLLLISLHSIFNWSSDNNTNDAQEHKCKGMNLYSVCWSWQFEFETEHRWKSSQGAVCQDANYIYQSGKEPNHEHTQNSTCKVPCQCSRI